MAAEITIVGAGPVGLLTALLLARRGHQVRILERRSEPGSLTRAIGIHSPSLTVLKQAGVLDAFFDEGLSLAQGLAYAGPTLLGRITFPDRHHAPLMLAQHRSERILRDAAIKAGARIEWGQTWQATDHDPATWLIGCDGLRSAVRDHIDADWQGRPYKDQYLMADLPGDDQPIGHIHLCRDGLVEALPFRDSIRWVVKVQNEGPEDFCRLIHERTGMDLDIDPDKVSAFGVQHYLASHVIRDKTLLLGDAAHVMSPIGGQGMNCGWLDAADACALICDEQTPAAFNQRIRSRAKRAAHRAAANMWLGRRRSAPFHALRSLGVRAALAIPPIRRHMQRSFTMQNL